MLSHLFSFVYVMLADDINAKGEHYYKCYNEIYKAFIIQYIAVFVVWLDWLYVSYKRG